MADDVLDGGVAADDLWFRYDPNMSVVDNIDLPPSLMSRFDLIYLVLDKPDPISDRRLAKHLLSMYSERGFLPSAVRPASCISRVSLSCCCCCRRLAVNSAQRN